MSVDNFTIEGLPEIEGHKWVQSDEHFIELRDEATGEINVGQIYDDFIGGPGVDVIYDEGRNTFWMTLDKERFSTVEHAALWLKEQIEGQPKQSMNQHQ